MSELVASPFVARDGNAALDVAAAKRTAASDGSPCSTPSSPIIAAAGPEFKTP